MNALAIFKGGVWVHESPALSAPSRFMTTVPDAAALVGLSQLPDADGYRWLHIQFDDGRGEGYVREDVTYVVGDISLWRGGKLADPAIARTAIPGASNVQNLHNAPAPVNPPAPTPASPPTSAAKWSAPVTPYTVTEPYEGPSGHEGDDLAGALGSPVVASAAGVIYRAIKCGPCSDLAPNLASHGISNPASVYSDPSWGFGFGNVLVVRHAFDVLPDAAKQTLATWKGGYAFVIYGHLRKFAALATAGANVQAGYVLGERGNTGNSSGPHLHLQVCMSLKATPDNPFNGPDMQLVDPRVLFRL